MTNSFEPAQKNSKKRDLPDKEENNRLVKFPGAAESTDEDGEKSRREKNKSENKNDKGQIFHPVDGIF